MKTTYTILSSVDRRTHHIVMTGSRNPIESTPSIREAEKILRMYNLGTRHGVTKTPIRAMPTFEPLPPVRKTFMVPFPKSYITAAAAYRYIRFGRRALYVGFVADQLETTVNALRYAFKEINAGKQCG